MSIIKLLFLFNDEKVNKTKILFRYFTFVQHINDNFQFLYRYVSAKYSAFVSVIVNQIIVCIYRKINENSD